MIKIPKQLAFIEAGKKYRHRRLISDNQTGKTSLMVEEISYHMTGNYPNDWGGLRFSHTPKIWAIGGTYYSISNTFVKQFLEFNKDKELKLRRRPGHTNEWNIDHISVKHSTNKNSNLEIKSIEDGPEVFMGCIQDFVYLDECNQKKYKAIYLGVVSRPHAHIVETYTDYSTYTDSIKHNECFWLNKIKESL